MLKDCNVWSFLVVGTICGCTAYIFHESLENDKCPVMEYDQNSGRCKLYVCDSQTKLIEE